MIVTTTTTLTIGLALHKVTDSPFARTRAATRGPDIVAELNPRDATRASAVTRGFAPLVHARGVAGTSGPYPIAFTDLRSRGVDVHGRGRRPRRRPGGDRPAGAHRRAGGSRPVRPSSSGDSPMRSVSASATRSISAGGRSASPGSRSAPLSASTRSGPPALVWLTRRRRRRARHPDATDRVHPQPEADRSVVRAGVRERQRRQRVLQRDRQRCQVVPAVMAGHRAAGLQGRLGRSEGAADRQHAAGAARDREHRRRGREPHGRADATSRAAQGRRAPPR